MKNEIERLSFDEAYDAATQENIAMIHGQSIVENEKAAKGGGTMNDNRLGCSIYPPDDAPEMEIYYKVIPGQTQTFNQPDIQPEVDVCDIAINGAYVSERVYNSLVADRLALESEIAEHLRKQAEIKSAWPERSVA